MVEILVALVIGLVLIAGVIQIYAANQQTYRVAEASSRIQENARFAMELLGRQLRMAGYRNNASQDFAMAFASVSFAGYSFNAGEIIRGTDDEVVIRYQGDGLARDCEDNSIIPAGTAISERLSLSGTDLQCATDMDAGGSQPLVSDIAGMAILYGVDTDGDGAANCFDSAASLNAATPSACGTGIAAPWNRVVSVRVSLLLQSTEDNITTAPQPYTFNGATVTPTDRRLRRVFTTTIGLRNRLP
ncbi:hypothetical protein JCM13664_06620 [Methylothermus subterraneus]